MKISEIVKLDCRKEQNKEIIENKLLEIEPLKGSCSLEMLEKLVSKIVRKYKVYISISWSHKENGNDWCQAHLRNESEFKPITTIYGCGWYDLWSKVCLYLWALVKSNKLTKRT